MNRLIFFLGFVLYASERYSSIKFIKSISVTTSGVISGTARSFPDFIYILWYFHVAALSITSTPGTCNIISDEGEDVVDFYQPRSCTTILCMHPVSTSSRLPRNQISVIFMILEPAINIFESMIRYPNRITFRLHQL